MNNTSGAGDRLRAFLERIERMREEIKALKRDEAAIFAEAKSAGFDVRVMRTLLKERAMTDAEREEQQALLEIYRKALGGYSDTPLGAAALRRFAPPPPDSDPNDVPLPFVAPASALEGVTEEQLLAAKAEGAAAAKAGKPVLANPYADARRAAWDEGWCAACGSDGMDIPAAFRRSKPKKPGRGRGGDGAAGGAA